MKTTMPAHAARYLAKAMLAAVGRDEVTPVLTGVHLAREGHALRATVTDRYRCHEVTLDAARTTGRADESVLVHHSAFTWILRTLAIVAPRRKIDDATVTIKTRKVEEVTQVTITIDVSGYDSVALTTRAIAGNFPPVNRIIEAAQNAKPFTGPVALNVGFLAKFDALKPGPYLAGHFHHSAHAERPNTPGPVLVTYEADGIAARGIIQPNLILR